MKVIPERGCGEIVVGAALADVETVHGPAVVDEETATWPALGIFVGLAEGKIASVAGHYTDPHEWLFGGKLTPFAGDANGITSTSTVEDIEAKLGKPIKVHDSKPWYVVYYDGIYFTFCEGSLSSWTVDPNALDDDDDEEDW